MEKPTKKPENIEEYKQWLGEIEKIDSWERESNYYQETTQAMYTQYVNGNLWKMICGKFEEFDQAYLVKTGYNLLLEEYKNPPVYIKPFESFLLKTYRKNVLENKEWNKPQSGGWLVPDTWYERINDVIRTTIAVKYLDGVEYIVNRIQELCEQSDAKCKCILEAREEGYYAAHIYIIQHFEVPRRNWDTENLECQVEIQVTTQLQEVIRRLLHKYYEQKRIKALSKSCKPWQWDYKSEEFLAGYLGHILHYMEAMIIEVRDKQKREA